MAYASNTSVPVERTRAEIERLVQDKGASQFMCGLDHAAGRAAIGFTMKSRVVRIEVPLPAQSEKQFLYAPRSTWRLAPKAQQIARWEQACRSRWRGVLLILKAKFEAIEVGVSTFEREFLADTLLPDGSTVGQWIQPQLTAAAERGEMPRLLLEANNPTT